MNLDQIQKLGYIPYNTAAFVECLEGLKYVRSKSVNLICADLPFGSTNCAWDSPIDLNKLWPEYERIIKDNGIILLFAQTPFDKVLGASNLKLLRYEWIWEKTQATGHLNAKKMPMKAHENILVYYKDKPKEIKKEDFNRTYNYIKTQGHERKVSTAHHKRNTSTGEIYGKCDDFEDYDSTERYPRSVLKFASDKQKENLHSTQKPLALIEYLIKTYSNENDLVLDNVSGSATTAVACENLNRNWIIMENDPKIYQTGLNRIINNRNLKNISPPKLIGFGS